MFFQVWAGVLFGVGGLLLVAVFLGVAWLARAPAVSYAQVAGVGYRIRRYWFLILSAAAIAALVLTLTRLPYAPERLASFGTASPMTVHVTGVQWGWRIDSKTLPAHRVIRFEVASRDVNHGFGIYDPGGHIVGQVQAMPGFTNVLVMRFDQPGTYRIRCLELCGLKHHQMTNELTVTA